MRLLGPKFVVGALATASLASAFVSPASRRSNIATTNLENNLPVQLQATTCGCDDVIMAGNPPAQALELDARKVIGAYSVQNAMGQELSMDELVLRKGNDDVSIVVFLRSLG
ncbi:expressed unknown protein [Seminavis robusta]|uniref:Uncharacterized protein n=1 Tax=Seminavis robusta TaxID=568900 RepID=A0A9N8DUL5_9STRA|nr:expressed unknown protein [Seminavis robusta]|eukprot:Sro384_g131360.1 n/a (112) ;mRNA; f:4724-5059